MHEVRNLSLILLGLLLETAFLTGDSNAANVSSNGGGGTCPQVMRLVAFVSEQTAYPVLKPTGNVTPHDASLRRPSTELNVSKKLKNVMQTLDMEKLKKRHLNVSKK